VLWICVSTFIALLGGLIYAGVCVGLYIALGIGSSTGRPPRDLLPPR